jgi:hypothetical protein
MLLYTLGRSGRTLKSTVLNDVFEWTRSSNGLTHARRLENQVSPGTRGYRRHVIVIGSSPRRAG